MRRWANHLDRLPPTIKNTGLLALLGNVLEAEPKPQSTGALRLRFFQPGFSWQALVDFAIAHDVLPPLVFALTQRGLLPPVPQTLSEEARAAHVTNSALSSLSAAPRPANRPSGPAQEPHCCPQQTRDHPRLAQRVRASHEDRSLVA